MPAGFGVIRVPQVLNGFTPASISGLVAWYRADKGTTIATGVSAWADQSGTGDANKNLAQGTGSKQPTLNASDAGYNNQATLSFASASSQLMTSGAWAVAPPSLCTILIVGNNDNAALQECFIDGTGGVQRYLVDNAGVAGTVRMFQNAVVQGAAVISAASAIVAVMKPNDVTGALYANAKTAIASGSVGAATTTAGITVGGSSAGAVTLNGKIAEIAIWNSALSAANVATVLAYASARYGITVGA